MNITSTYYFVIDVIIIAIFALNFFFSYKNGVLYELISLLFIIISIFLGYFLSPILAARFYLITTSTFNNAEYINLSAIYYGINVIVWFILVSLFFIILFTLIKPFFKFVTKVPVVGWLNKIAGMFFGLIKGFVICSFLSFVLCTTFINNSNDIKNRTLLKYVDFLSTEAAGFISKNIDFKRIDENISDFDLQVTRKVFEEWLLKQGFINE